MTKREQIEEMAYEIETRLGYLKSTCYNAANVLYHAGYRKESKNYIGTDEVLRSIDYRPVEEVRKETAKEFAEEVTDHPTEKGGAK